jgi:hypothetical protein
MSMNFDHLYLEDNQKTLLVTLAKAYREQPTHERQEFLYIRTMGLNQIEHPQLPDEAISVFHGDMQALQLQNLIVYSSPAEEVFNLTPLALAFSSQLQRQDSPQEVSTVSSPVKISPDRDHVFISYSHADKEWLEYLQVMLRPLTRTKEILLWDDTKLRGGDKWKEEIRKALAVTKVAVMIVSPHFLASDFIAEHELPPLLKAAQDEGVKILWVLASDCLYNVTELADFQASHEIKNPLDSLSVSERNRVLKSVALQIATAANAPNPR